MANALLDAIAQGNDLGKALVWLDAEAYGSRVLLQNQAFPWHNPTEFVSAYTQLQSLLKAQVAPVNLGRFLRSWLAMNPAALAEMGGKKRVRFAIKRLLGNDDQRQLIREIVSALCESRPEPVVLVLPPNGELINWANKQANGADPAALTEIDIDSVSVYLADFMRTFSGLDIAGVLVELPGGSDINPQLLDMYSPIVNVAKHYHWALGMAVAGGTVQDPEQQLQFVVADTASKGVTGLVQSEAFWERGVINWQPPHFVYASVPPDITPELVLERLAETRDRAPGSDQYSYL